jgi:hypothetical protein
MFSHNDYASVRVHHADNDVYLDDDGRAAVLSESDPPKSWFQCECCHSKVSVAWEMTAVVSEIHADNIVCETSYACTKCVTVVD